MITTDVPDFRIEAAVAFKRCEVDVAEGVREECEVNWAVWRTWINNNFVLFCFLPAGFHNNNNNNFNDRQGGFHDRDSGPTPRGRGDSRNWRDDDEPDRDRRNFGGRGNGGNPDRKSSRWMDNQQNDEWNNEQQQQPQEMSDLQDQTSRNDDDVNDNGREDGGNNDFNQQDQCQEEAPPGTNDQQYNHEDPASDSTLNLPSESFDDHHNQQDSNVEPSGTGEENQGNTTPLCDEAEAKE